MKKTQEEVRIQIDLDPDAAETLDQLRDDLGFKSRGQTIITALALLEWAVSEAESGRKIAAIEDDRRYVELMLPGLRKLQRKGLRAGRSAEEVVPAVPPLAAPA